MTELLDYIVSGKHRAFRKTVDYDPAEEFAGGPLSALDRMTTRFEKMCALQEPVFLPGEKICFMRTAVAKNNDVFSKEEWEDIRSRHYIHELGYISNLSPDYESIIRDGLLSKRENYDIFGKRVIDAILSLTERYRKAAEEKGLADTAEVLSRVPAYGARTFREALQSFRIIHFALWLENDYHNTVGLFDRYMYPYLKSDIELGILNEDSALELLEDFFISFNKDSDLYVGVQQGDNGQSMVLGGEDENGNYNFNLLSSLCLRASEELKLIDPKINLRVSSKTADEIYVQASRLTKAGLGFPQYSNDDVVIDSLVKMGYERKDAVNYVVAACWEFIIPKVGADIANIGALSFPKCVDTALHSSLEKSETFEDFYEEVKKVIISSCENICSGIRDIWFVPSPFMNVMMNGLLFSRAKYNNFGIHGTGLSTAADSLAAIKKYVYDEKRFSKKELLCAVDSDFENAPEMLHVLRYEAPKMGQGEDLPDEISVRLLDDFSSSLSGKKNCLGGIYRAGTGSAMYYLWHADEIGASPDGRRKGEPFGANFSPSLFAKINGPLSVVRSFTKQHFENVCNGGPLTMEFHSSMFDGEDSIKKVASLVRTFASLGGHQLQLNAVNPDKLKDAQIHPENYRQLVVRIWGWSAYFVELDKAYQDHVIKRQEYII